MKPTSRLTGRVIASVQRAGPAANLYLLPLLHERRHRRARY